jgi:predicted restriction endonuclease
MNNGKYHTEQFKRLQTEKIDRMWGPIEKHNKTCECCKKEFIYEGRIKTKAYKLARFCSRSCANNRQNVWDKKPIMQNGIWRYRKIAINTHGEKCVVCGFDKVIEIHHIDEDRTNNTKENLVPLCPNHHTMIHRSKYVNEVKQEILNYLGL